MYKSMRSKSPEKSGLQKVARQTYRIETEYNPEATPQYFQIAVHIIEARKLAWSNPQSANSYVIVVLDKKKHRTSIRKNMVEPCYKENFMFEMYTSILKIRQSYLWLAVMEPRCCAPPRLLGEANIDLGTVWSQPHHQVFHKWAQLCLQRNSAAGAMGFLKVDISIIYRGELQVLPFVTNTVEDKLENTLLLPVGSEQQRANYLITIFNAFGLPNGTHCHGDKRYGKPPTTFVRVSFCGLVAKTATQHRTDQPMYCERISMVEMFPNMNQMIFFEVCSAEGSYNKVLASTQLNLSQISHDGENGFLPTFGPSLLHMYGTTCASSLALTAKDGPYHRGVLLVALKTIVPYYKQSIRTTSVEPVVHIRPENLWISDDFCVFCPIFEISMIDKQIVGKSCGVAITLGEVYCEHRADEEFLTMIEEIRNHKLHYTGGLDVTRDSTVYGHVEFTNALPVLQLATRFPDFRFRIYRNNMVNRIVDGIESAVREVEQRLYSTKYSTPNDLLDLLNRAFDEAAVNITKFLEITKYLSYTNNFSENALRQCGTELDLKQLTLQKEEMTKIHHIITRQMNNMSNIALQSGSKPTKNYMSWTKKAVKLLLAESKNITQNLKNIMYKASEGWPDLVVWILSGGTRVGYSKISLADILYSTIPEQSGKYCGQIQTVYLKPLKCPKHLNVVPSNCYCIAAKLEIIAWMGSFREREAFKSCLPAGYKFKTKDYDICIKTTRMMLECRAFVYRAKISDTKDSSPTHPFLRVNVMNAVKETQVKQNTLTPVWNQVLKINRMHFATLNRLTAKPPEVLIEVYHSDLAGKTDLIGRFQILPNLDDKQEHDNAPRLLWYEMRKGIENTGQVLMSVQMLQVPEKLLKTTVYSPVEETFFASEIKELEDPDAIETLPPNIMPKYCTYKVDVYWWGLRDVNVTRKPCVVLEIEDLSLKSDIISEKKNSCNFPNGRLSQTFEAPLDECYCPPLNIRLYDSSTFGRTLFFGTYVVKNPMKYFINWLPKSEREASLKRASIMSSSFIKVGQAIFVKKSSPIINENIESISNTTNLVRSHIKKTTWKRLFRRSEPSEEEFTLLPMFTSRNKKTIVKEILPNEQRDWWLRYLSSLKQCVGEDKLNAEDKLIIYDSELELQLEFSKFKDWCSTLKLYNGNKTGIREKDDQLYCGILKAGIAMYRWPPPLTTVAVSPNGVELNRGYFEDYPTNDNSKFLIRVYLVKALNLVSKDFTGKTNPYVVIDCGNKHLGDRNTFIPKTFNPIFGKMYEFSSTIPEDYLLTISVYDYNSTLPDELIGSTYIDLEDRIYSKHRGRVGLSNGYILTGPGKWRDCIKPSAILEEVCERNHLPAPTFPDSVTVLVNGVEYRDNERDKIYGSIVERKENICLALLHNWHTLPICGYHLVPEHVETRTLYNPANPDVKMGKLQMWVDIFPQEANFIPSPIDITPRKIEEFVLRVKILNVNGVNFRKQDKKKGIALYVRAWIGSPDQAQQTNVHYHYTNGVCNFNWGMIFTFKYQHAEGKLITPEKGTFIEVDEHIPPVLIVQLMDRDNTSTDDFLDNELGSLHLNLNTMPVGVNLCQQCTLDTIEKTKRISLFAVRSVRAWWPLKLIDRSTGSDLPAGCVELELTLFPKETAVLMHVGFGKDLPSSLTSPTCHDSSQTSQKWFLLFKKHKCMVISVLTLFVMGLLCTILIKNYAVILDTLLG